MLSFGKIILIVVVLIVAMVGFRLVGVMKNVHAREKPPKMSKERKREQKAAPPPTGRASDLSACPHCGAYTDGPCTNPACLAKR